MLCMALPEPSTTARSAYGVIAGLDKLCARRVPKESAMRSQTVGRPATHPRTGFVGTDFRHAVEFSRSGRAPSTASQPCRGQLSERYVAGFAVSNRSLTRTAHSLGPGRDKLRVPREGARPAWWRTTCVRGRAYVRRPAPAESNPPYRSLPGPPRDPPPTL
jgi:hypothetical protein